MTLAEPQPNGVYTEPDLQVAASVGVLGPSLARREPLLARHLRRGLWRRYGQVVVTHNGPLTAEQVLWVAVLRAPRGTVVAGLTAGVRRGVRGPEPEVPRLLVPFGAPLPHLAGIAVRRSRRLEAVDVHPLAQPPQLRLPRAVLDEVARTARADEVRALLCAPVQQRLVRAGDLRAVALRLGPFRHRTLTLETLEEVEYGAHSRREVQFMRLVRRAGLPVPRLQVLRRHGTSRHYLDAAWEEYALHVEVDGLGHLAVVQWAADCDRANELELGKHVERRLRFPGFWLDEHPDRVLDQLRRGLRAGGWRG